MNSNDIQALLNNTATIKTRINILATTDESSMLLTEEDAIEKWTYNDFRYVEDEGFIGQFVARSLEGTFHNINSTFNVENREMQLELGITRIVNDEEITTYYSLGNFLVQKPIDNDVNDNTHFEALDYTIYFNKGFNGDFKNTTYTTSFNELLNGGSTVTAKWLAEYTCAQAGVTLGSQTFTNSSFLITSNQFDDGDTCRDVIKAIAKLSYTWARIGWDNKLYFDFTVKTKASVESYNNITSDNYYTLETQKNIFGPVNRVLIGSSTVEGETTYIEDSVRIETYGTKQISVFDNPIIYTPELRASAITNGTVLYDLEYTPMTLETTGHPWLLGNELIKVTDMNGNYKYTYPFNRTITYAGHIRTTLTSYAQTEIEQEYTYSGSGNLSETLKRTRLIVDKANQSITGLIDSTYTKTEIQEIARGQFESVQVSYVSTEQGKFTNEGLRIQKINPDDPTKIDSSSSSLFNEFGLMVQEVNNKTIVSGKPVFFSGYMAKDNPLYNYFENYENQSITATQNIIVDKYAEFGGKSRIEVFTDEDNIEKTGMFDIGGN